MLNKMKVIFPKRLQNLGVDDQTVISRDYVKESAKWCNTMIASPIYKHCETENGQFVKNSQNDHRCTSVFLCYWNR